MANYRITYHLTLGDIDGNIAETSFSATSADSTTVAALATKVGTFATDVQTCSNAKVLVQRVSILINEAQILPGSTPPTDAVYPTVTDGARLNFSNSDGAKASLTVPAPTETTFLPAPQRNYVDPAGDASALIALIKSSATDPAVNYLNLYQGGVKVGKGARRRRPPKAGLS